jgi:plasmid maintenance system antidote protein VapI
MPDPLTWSWGTFLDEELAARGIKRRMLRRPLGLSLEEIDDLIEGRRALTRDLAERIGRHLGTSAELWLNLDRIHRAAAGAPQPPEADS